MTTDRRDKAMTPEDWAKYEAQRAEQVARDPQLSAMAEANQYTVTEQSDLADAEAAVLDREAEYHAAGVALNEARTTGFLGRETADLDLLERDLAEARLAADNARKRRNMLRRRIDAARAARRWAAKTKHAPSLPPVKSRGDWWSSTDRISGRRPRQDAA